MIAKRKQILIGLCKTRWSERDKAFEYFHGAFLYIIEAFEITTGVHSDIIKYDEFLGWDSQSKKDALSYMNGLCDFSYIISMISLKSLLHPLHATTVRLQGKTNGIIMAYQDINNVIYNLKYTRGNVEIEFKNIFSEAEQIAATVCLPPSLPRIVPCITTSTSKQHPTSNSRRIFSNSGHQPT